jgi:molybdopterin-guanine dinucleotide biosynthesis protein A
VTEAHAADPPSYDAIVLAGGSSRRLGGTDKTRLTIGELTLLDRVLHACAGAALTVAVGEPRPTVVPVTWTREDPPGGGPAAAVAAGLRNVTAPVVVLLAGDLPFVTASLVAELARAAQPAGVVAVDAEGNEQWLMSAWPTALLRAAELRPDGSLRGALRGLRSGEDAPARLPVGDRDALDCDTPDDVRRARELA